MSHKTVLKYKRKSLHQKRKGSVQLQRQLNVKTKITLRKESASWGRKMKRLPRELNGPDRNMETIYAWLNIIIMYYIKSNLKEPTFIILIFVKAPPNLVNQSPLFKSKISEVIVKLIKV